MTPLLDALIELLGGWRDAFPRQRSFLRAISHVLALAAVLGRRTITRVILVKGAGYGKGWNSEYKLFRLRMTTRCSGWGQVFAFREES